MIPNDLLSSFPRFLYFSRGAITSRLARLCGKAEGRGMSWSWVAREYPDFVHSRSAFSLGQEDRGPASSRPSFPQGHGGSLSRNGSDCQALCREWSRASRRRRDIAVRPLPVKKQPSPQGRGLSVHFAIGVGRVSGLTWADCSWHARRGWPGPELPVHRPLHPLTIATSGTPQVWRRRRGGFLPGYRNRDLHPYGRERLQFARRRAGKTCDCPFVEPEGSRETLKIG